MSYKQRETSREVRLWISQIIIPTLVGVGIIATNSELRNTVKSGITKAKETVKNLFQKKKES